MYREPPQSLEAEQSLLGAILVNNETLDRVAGLLEPHHFYDPLHRHIYEVAAKLIAGGKKANPITLKPYFESADPISPTETVPQYLGRLGANATTIINVRDYARTIHDLSIRRSLIDIGETVVNAAYDTPIDFPPKEQIEEAEQRLYALAENRGEQHVITEPVAVRNEFARIREAYRNPDAGRLGISTGLADLDRKLGGGLQPSDLITLAGRPAMGKTALAGTILRCIDVPAVFFSLEMTAEQIARRMISAETGIPTDRLRSGDLSESEAAHLVRAEEAMMLRIEVRGVILDQTGGISIANLTTRARRLKRQRNIGLVIVDYLQLITGSAKRASDGRVQEVSEISGGLKALAKELNVPVLALSQLSREVEKRNDKRPHLADLRESGSIEQDSDVVMFVFREEYYVRQQQPSSDAERATRLAKLRQCGGKGEIIVSKNRHGPTGTVDVHFDGTATLFSNLAAERHSDDTR